jgi:hypothetical protein
MKPFPKKETNNPEYTVLKTRRLNLSDKLTAEVHVCVLMRALQLKL